MSTKRTHPPRDSWIELKPGESILIDREHIGKAYPEAVRKGRGIRGDVLAAAYEIEYMIDQIITSIFVPYTPDDPRKNIFDKAFLKSSGLRLNNKLKIIKMCTAEIESISGLISSEILDELYKIKDVRNDFAHYPIKLIPDKAEPIKELTIVLCGSTQDIELSDEYVLSLYQSLERCKEILNTAVGTLDKESTE